MRAVCADFETELVEFNGEDNHVHLLVNFPPKVALGEAGQQPQEASRPAACGRSSPTSPATTTGPTSCGRARTSPGSVGGAPLTVVRQYIEQQNRPV